MIGEVCGYTETWSVPANDLESLKVYTTMFSSYLFNISNTSLWNITFVANTPKDFAERAEELDADQGRRLQWHGQDYSWVDWRQPFDLKLLFPDRLVENPLTPKLALDYYNVIDCSREGRAEALPEGFPFTVEPHLLVRLRMTFLTESDRGKFACLSLSTRNAMREMLAPFGMTPCRDRSYRCRADLEIDPAPSPPPPTDWNIPPSPPAYVYEVLTLTAATGGSALFFVIGCICCVAVGGNSLRERRHSRMLGTERERVDTMPFAPEEERQRGDGMLTGPLRPDLRQPARRLNTGFSFGGMDLRYDAVRR